MPIHLNRCQTPPFGSSSSKARPMLFWLARPTAMERWEPRPTANSMTMMGMLKINRNTRYMRTNAAPPYSPVM